MMKRVTNNDGIAPWKIDHPVERFLAKAADKSNFAKKLYVDFYRFFDKDYYQKGLKFIQKNVQTFVGEVSEDRMREYTYDMVYSLHRFGCMFDEYFFYGYETLNTQGRESFITDKIRWDYYAQMNQDENKELFNNKRKAYELFGAFYKRELIEITEDADAEKFRAFAKSNECFIVKPIDGSGGRGIYITCREEYENLDVMFGQLRKYGPVVVEELISQCADMAALHPESLNTLRVPTVKLKDRVVLLPPVLRMGRGKAIVDNATSGGIIVAVDADTGICTRVGVDEQGNSFIRHPDTGVVLPGFQIPRWDEAVALVNELAHVVQTNNYVGWDLALTDQGWVMVEGNPRGQMLMQIATPKGMKEEIEAYIAQM